jgi:hypothetical protein
VSGLGVLDPPLPGPGIDINFSQLFETVVVDSESGIAVRITVVPTRSLDASEAFADAESAATALGWELVPGWQFDPRDEGSLVDALTAVLTNDGERHSPEFERAHAVAGALITAIEIPVEESPLSGKDLRTLVSSGSAVVAAIPGIGWTGLVIVAGVQVVIVLTESDASGRARYQRIWDRMRKRR